MLIICRVQLLLAITICDTGRRSVPRCGKSNTNIVSLAITLSIANIVSLAITHIVSLIDYLYASELRGRVGRFLGILCTQYVFGKLA